MDPIVTKRMKSGGGANQAPTYDASIVLREGGRSLVVDEMSASPLSHYIAFAYDLPTGVLIERTAVLADEGLQASEGRAWYCAAGAYRPVQ